MNRFYEYLADQMIAHAVANPEDKDVIVYGLDMIIYTLVSLGALVLFGALFDLALPTALILLIELPIQNYGGGYHARTHFMCFFWMTVFWSLSISLYVFAPDVLVYILAIPAVFILWKYVPIEHVNAPMSSEKKVRMRKCTHTYLAILSIIFCMTTLLKPMIAKIIALAILDCGISYVMALFSEDTVHQSD